MLEEIKSINKRNAVMRGGVVFGGKKIRTVLMFNEEMELLQEFDTISDIYRFLGKNNVGGNITKYCKNKRMCYGYYFRYKEDYQLLEK